MTTKEEFFKGIQERKEKQIDEQIYWSYIYDLIKDYSYDKAELYRAKLKNNEDVTVKEIEIHKAYCVFENINN